MDEEFDYGDMVDDNEFTTLQEVAIITHEIYEAYMNAGFSSQQALWLAATYQSDLSIPDC